MKRSHEVVLWMLGAGLGISLLSETRTTEQLKQDKYASRTDCVKDWGAESQCEEDAPGSGGGSGGGGSGGGSGGGYHGPRYYWDRSAGQPVTVSDSGAHQLMPAAHPGGLSHASVDAGTVSRGGFGHFGFHSGGG
ncbi:MAG: hypothetical protein PHP85_07740 [Gallionella sp.]|nr:hypothetical protein [Gallionella sp.]